MSKSKEDYFYKEIKDKGTGSHGETEKYKVITYPFERYQIKIQLTSDNKFIGVIEVKLNKEFLSHEQKTKAQGYIDVDEDYPE